MSFGIASLAAVGRASAAELYVGPRIGQSVGYTDNILLAPDNPDDAVTATTTAGITVGARSPVMDLSLDAEVDYTAYLGSDQPDADTEQLTGRASRDVTPRTQLGLNAGIVRDSTLTNFLDSTGQLARNNDPRLTFFVTPSISHRLTPLDTLDASLSWRTRSYQQGQGADFTTWSGSVGWQERTSRRTTLGGNFYASYYSSDIQETTSASPRLYVGYAYEERVDLSLSIGPSFNRLNGQDRLGYTLDGTLRLDLTAASSLSLTASHYLEPASDTGDTADTSRVLLGYNQLLSRRLSLDVGALAQHQAFDGASPDRDFLYASAGLRYALTERLSVGVDWQLQYQHFESGGGDATSNAVMARLDYAIPEYRRSW